MNRLKTVESLSQEVLAAKTKKEKWQLWEKALRRDGNTLKESFIRENMDYLEWPRDKVLSCWGERGTKKIKERWNKENPKTKDEIENFYNNQELYIPELSSWHAIVENEALLRIVDFLKFCTEHNFSSFLDFGAGIGSSALVFHYYGFQVTLADISGAMLNYAKWRFKRHNIREVAFIDLKKKSLGKEMYDCVCAIEVLEHLVNPIETMDEIRISLKKGGCAFVTTPFFKDRERPQHLIQDIKTADRFEKLGFKLISISKDKVYRVLERVR